ncbi:hypothetical protein H312_02847 [Anncaliia algerae PRA339]|uniref:ISXO2-like transposase domain-containing protein n=1 Tax=Anncaliia algerae PRA339 TaxID=1288291 RepID=A0A059EYE0_9MICR|nr:hypothetical protein H312_02847 [Anncaliia algerae PRA339]
MVSYQYLCNWYKKLQSLSFFIMRDESNGKIVGRSHIIEIDESKFSKRKYQVGRIINSPWVVGGIDVSTKEFFFVEVINRNSDTLKGIVLDKIYPGSLIVTDEWRGYWGLENFGFHHSTFNNYQNSICPLTGAKTSLLRISGDG